MVAPLVVGAWVGGVALVGAVGGYLAGRNKEPDSVVYDTAQTTITNQYLNQTAVFTFESGSTVERFGFQQVGDVSANVEPVSEFRADTGAVTSSNINTALLVGGGLAVAYLFLRGGLK